MPATTYTITYHNHYDGSASSSITLNDNTNRIIYDVRGFGFDGIQIPTQRAPYTDGAALLGTPFTTPGEVLSIDWPKITPYFGPRVIEIVLRLTYSSLTNLITGYNSLATYLTPYAPPFKGDTSYLQIAAGWFVSTGRQIECFCTGLSNLDMRGTKDAIVTARFFCPSPFFRQLWADSSSSTTWNTGTNPLSITNTGAAPLWPVIKVFGRAGGTVAGLHLTNNTTGKIWSTSQTIATGAANYITAYMDRAKMEYFDGATTTDIITTLDTDAEFWNMQIGANSLQFSSTGTPSSIVVYHPWYYLTI